MNIYNVSEVAKILGVGKGYIYELIYKGRLKAVRLSERRFRISEEALQDFIKQEEARVVSN